MLLLPPLPLLLDLVQWLRELFLIDTAPTHKGFIISRAKASTRRVLNEAELADVLQIPAICLEDLSVFQQASLFHGANLVIGPYGSGFTNLLYCKPGTRVFQLDTDCCIDSFGVMARDLNLDFQFGPATFANIDAPWADYTADLPSLKRLVSR
jgi:capsular polysaccharide biosynthesis protein